MPEPLVFRGGMPYEPDVNRLKERFPASALTEGRVIGHAELETALVYKKGTPRYYGVINSWMAYCEGELGIYLRWKAQIGLEVMEPAVHFEYRETGLKQKLRGARKAARRVATVPRHRLDAIGQARFDHVAREAAMIAQWASDKQKQLAIELSPVKSLPKPKLVGETA